MDNVDNVQRAPKSRVKVVRSQRRMPGGLLSEKKGKISMGADATPGRKEDSLPIMMMHDEGDRVGLGKGAMEPPTTGAAVAGVFGSWAMTAVLLLMLLLPSYLTKHYLRGTQPQQDQYNLVDEVGS
ncbi:hypothetical protein N7539_002893 [Penicillium diatomitis]|uniref:Uncharacterized protein n=1 Tax=Penicillium diatomitis TaxID=2819901 RepID=A0A9W9XFR8_9EURO|nr:uncharacterized protein N7539_002893 [Penicillium diatomitis]KAJ5491326.1 hypothetical protein N7539_002893 [Penicillium diatomitis]